LFAAAKVNNILWACRYNKTFYSWQTKQLQYIQL
jgi:hypothetical protein